MTNLVVRRSILICVVLSPMWLGYTRAASEKRRPATDHELQLARTVTEFLRSWCEKRDPEAAADFLSAEAFIAECGSREDDSEVPQADKVRAQYVEAFSDALRNLLDPGSLSDLISAPVDPGTRLGIRSTAHKRAAGTCTPRTRGQRLALLHQRDDGPTQGGDANPPQPAGDVLLLLRRFRSRGAVERDPPRGADEPRVRTS